MALNVSNWDNGPNMFYISVFYHVVTYKIDRISALTRIM